MSTLTLTENTPSTGVSLTREQIARLRQLVPSIVITPSPFEADAYDLTPGSYVGVVSLGKLLIEIQPRKAPTSSVFFLLSYALDPICWSELDVPFDTSTTLLEAVGSAFAKHTRRALARGLLRGYRIEEEALLAVRGRIRFADQLRRRFGLVPPVECQFDEHTEDIVENRLLRAASLRLLQLRPRLATLRSDLRGLDWTLTDITRVDYDYRSVPDVVYTRLNAHYRTAVELARLILRASSLEFQGGDVHSSAFVVDMGVVFETFVAVALREALRLDERTFPQNAHGHKLYLDHDQRVRLEPDLSWWNGPDLSVCG